MTDHPPGASLHLGGTAHAHPDLEHALTPITGSRSPRRRRLTPYPGNPRKGDQDAITASIRDLGLYRTLIVQQSTGHVLAGNHTLRALTDLGATHAPVTWVDVDDTRAAAIVARDNLTSDRGTYDDAELLRLLTADEDVLALSGYDDDSVAALARTLEPEPEQLGDPDEAPPVPEAEPISRPGDVWDLGPHRLVVGDSTQAATYDQLLGDTLVHCVWTDPPYGIDYVGKTKAAKTIQNDGKVGLEVLLTDALGHACDRSQAGAHWYVAYADKAGSVLPFLQVLDQLGVYRQNLSWVKDRFVLGHGDYHSRYEPIAYGWKPGAARLHPLTDRTQDTVWEIPRPARSEDHPTMKPVELVARALRNSTNPGDLVLDPFGGSGTTLIACHLEGRLARLVELDPRYADVICRRYQTLTGTVPVRDSTPVDFLGAA